MSSLCARSTRTQAVRHIWLGLLGLLVSVSVWAASTPDVEPVLLPFAAPEGLERLTRASASASADFAALANQFEAQSNAAFCGPTSVAIVLNALHAHQPDLPRDRSRLQAADLRHFPATFDPSLPRYTQDNVIPQGRKTRAQVLGEPMPVAGRPGQLAPDFGYQLRQLDELLQAHGLRTQLRVVDADLSEARIRAELVANLQRADDYVIVAYRRDAVGQKGGGHISPLGAYDAASDSVLVLDVNPTQAGWVWMPVATLVRGMRSFDTLENRGYIQVRLP